MITLKESLLSRTKDKVGNFDMSKVLNIPTVKDFYINQWNRNLIEVKWHCEELLSIYKSEYPKAFKSKWDKCHLCFQIDKTIPSFQLLYIYIVNSENGCNYWLSGWYHSFTDSNLRVYKKHTIDIIKKLAENPDAMDNLFSHAAKQRLENGEHTELKDLLYDL